MIGSLIFFLKKLFLDKNEKTFIEKISLINLKTNKKRKKKNILLVIPNDYSYVCYYHSIFNDRFVNSNIYGYWPYPIHVKRKRFLEGINEIKSNLYFYFIKKKFFKIYEFLGLNSLASLYELKTKFIEKNEEKKITALSDNIFKRLRNKREILKLNLLGIDCGDLIYDTYIRFRNKPTVDIKDKFLRKIIFISLLQIICFKKMQKRHGFTELYTSYATYIHYGILVRVFLKYGVKIYSGYSLSQYNKRITKNDHYHVENYRKFKKIFSNLKDKRKKYNKAKNLIDNIFFNQRKKVEFMDYMRTDPYKNNFHDLIKNYSGVIFLPNFFESQREWGELIFLDFYEWANFTLKLIEEKKLNIAIKPHPNIYHINKESVEIVNELKFKYPSVDWIDPSTSNKKIFKKIKFGVSPWGTILWEMAYFNVIPISAGDHPACKYNFGYEPRNINAYENLLINGHKLIKKKIHRKSIYEFCYMYYIHNNDSFKNKARLLKLNQIDFSDSGSLITFINKMKNEI